MVETKTIHKNGKTPEKLTIKAKIEVKTVMEMKMNYPSYIKEDRYTGCLLWRGAVAGGNTQWGQGQYSTIKFRSRSGLLKPFQVGGHIVQLFLKTGELPLSP